MITERELLREIEECQKQPITDKKFERLASCFIVYDHLFGESIQARYSETGSPEKIIQTDGGSEFLNAINGKESAAVWHIVNELMESLRVLHPRLYDAVLDKISK